MRMNTMKTLVASLNVLMATSLCFGQCADTSNIYTFTYNAKTYEVIKENRTWIEAAACAVERGGVLAEINDADEQEAIFSELMSNSGVVPGIGPSAYVWIGGNDISEEGTWVWDGDNDGEGPQFWMGDFNGSPVGGLYNNWGDEPDDASGFGQDCLALALVNWPFGIAGQWNDIERTESFKYIVEYPIVLSLEEIASDERVDVFPNPIDGFVNIELSGVQVQEIVLLSSLGQSIAVFPSRENTFSERIDFSYLDNGLYYLGIRTKSGDTIVKKVVVE